MDMDLNDPKAIENDGGFDQMKFNEQHFGLDDDFNEENYTTPLDMNDFSKDQIKEAHKLAQSIEKSELPKTMNNRHMREERNQQPLVDNEDEEDLYSAVVRQKGEGKAQQMSRKDVKTTAVPEKSASPERPKFHPKKISEKKKDKLEEKFMSVCGKSWSGKYGANQFAKPETSHHSKLKMLDVEVKKKATPSYDKPDKPFGGGRKPVGEFNQVSFLSHFAVFVFIILISMLIQTLSLYSSSSSRKNLSLTSGL